MPLELRSISRRFGKQLALDHVSMRILPGDCYGFIGHNGAGKTTAMRVALGLQRPDGGTVVVDGFDARSSPREARARMGALIETPGFQPGWSGVRNLTELARLQGIPRAGATREAERWIERLGLVPARGKPVRAWSHGMRQRLGIAQALLGTPRYVLLDEPMSGLDPEGIAEVRELLRSLAGAGTTILVSSHQLTELTGICNRIGVLDHGRLLVEEETGVLLGTSRWRLEVRDAAKALAAVQSLGLAPVVGADGALRIELAGQPPERCTRALFERGVDVVSFAEEKPTLEEIYLRFRAGGAPRDMRAEAPQSKTRTLATGDEAGPDATPTPAQRLAPRAPVRRMAAFDLRRYAGSLGTLALLATPALIGAIAMLRRSAQGAADRGAVASATLFSSTDVNAFEVVGLALQAGLPALAFIALALGSQSIAAEYGRGTLRNVLLRPLTRTDAAVGKSLALLALVLGSYLALAAVALALGAAFFGFRDASELLPNGARFVLVPAAEIWPELRRALISPLLPLAAYVGLGFLAGALARTGAAALGLALALGVVLDVGRTFTRAFGLGASLPSDHLPSPLSDTSAIRFYVDVSQGVSNAQLEHAAAAWIVPATWGLLAFVLASWRLARRPIP